MGSEIAHKSQGPPLQGCWSMTNKSDYVSQGPNVLFVQETVSLVKITENYVNTRLHWRITLSPMQRHKMLYFHAIIISRYAISYFVLVFELPIISTRIYLLLWP